MLSLALLGAALVGGLLLIPFGLPGLWVMLGAALLHWVLVLPVVVLVGQLHRGHSAVINASDGPPSQAR